MNKRLRSYSESPVIIDIVVVVVVVITIIIIIKSLLNLPLVQ